MSNETLIRTTRAKMIAACSQMKRIEADPAATLDDISNARLVFSNLSHELHVLESAVLRADQV